MIYNTCKNISELNDLSDYFNSDLINDLYFKPKKVNKNLIDEKLKNSNYIEKFNNTINRYKDYDIEKLISEKISNFEKDTSFKLDSYKIYVIIGLDTTTIYSIKYNDEDVTVLLLESTNGNMDNLDMLLAHEFTHFVRRQIFKRDIFENSIGERFIVEGIGCNYSREIVPNKEDYEYCIVNKDTIEWVKNNIDKVEEHMYGKMDTNELMSDYFYMFADTEKTGLPARTGYVYGYLKVKEYLENNNLRIKDIIDKDWKDILK
jgi:uncharacterized protein YjaZ